MKYPAPQPFSVLPKKPDRARENDRLPEAPPDRLMVQLTVGYPSREADERIVAVHVRPC